MKKKKPTAWLFLLILILGGLVFRPALPAGEAEVSEYGNPFMWVTVGQVKVKAEVVITPEKQFRGLGRRPELPEGRGMLFVMPSKVRHTFCMRDMHFPLDFIWLADGRVVGITRDVSHQDPDTRCQSPEPAKYVLEVPAGFCDRHGIKVGDPVTW